MTVPNTTSRDQQNGNGITLAFTVPFRILNQTHIRVLLTVAGVTTEQALTTNYSVSGVGNQNTTVTFVVPPPPASKITFLLNVPATQETDYVPNDPFPAESHEAALDKLTMLVQQLNEVAGEGGRTIKIPAEVSGVSTTLPVPAPNTLWGWDAEAGAPRLFTLTEVATVAAYAAKLTQTYVGDGSETEFTLPADPGSIGNLDVSIDGVVQVPVTDFSYSGTKITFTDAPANGAVIFVRLDEALPTGITIASAVGFTQTGIGATPSTVDAEIRREFWAEQFGAVGDGVNDDAAAINRAITAANTAGGGVVRLRGKTYAIGTAGIVLKDKVTLRGAGMGATELLQAGTPAYVVTAQGALAAAVLLTGNALVGATTLQLASTATLAAGDYLILSDAYAYNPLDATYISGEMVRVLTVDSATQVTLYAPVKGSMYAAGTYATANTASVRKLSLVNCPAIEALTITGDQASTTGLISLKYCYAPRVRDVQLRNGGHYGLRIDTCRDGAVSGLTVRDLIDDLANGHVGYGLLFAGANDGVTVENSHFSRCRHATTTIGGPDGFSHRIVVNGCIATATTQAGFDTHAAGDGILYSNCEVHGAQQQGISIRSINTEVRGCIISRPGSHGIAATETLVRNMVVSNCTVEYAGQHGFNASNHVEGLIVSNNTFRAPVNDGVRVDSTSLFVQILDNYIIAPGNGGTNRSGITSIANGATAARWLIARNFIRADTGSVAFGIQTPNVNSSWVVDNKLYGTFGTGALNLGTNTDLRNDTLT